MCIHTTATVEGEPRFHVQWYEYTSEGKKRKNKTFKDYELAKAFEKTKIDEVETRRKRKITDRIEGNAVKRKKGLETNGGNHATEAKAIRLLAPYISNLHPVVDGAHSDLVKLSNVISKIGWGLQVKSATQRQQGKAIFKNVNKYPDLVVICVLLSEQRVWLFHGRDLINLKGNLGIGKKSKYNQHEIHFENLDKRLTSMLQEYQQHDIEHYNRQLSPTQLNEYLTHQRWISKTKATVKAKQLGALEHGVVDCIEIIQGGQELNIQEKIAHKHKNGFLTHLCKSAGRNGKTMTRKPYEEGDCDIYRVFINKYGDEWSHGRDKTKIESATTIGFFHFSERVLIDKGYITSGGDIGKTGMICYLPEDVCQNVGLPLPKWRSCSLWTREYFHLL